jgi:hypothetical protein
VDECDESAVLGELAKRAAEASLRGLDSLEMPSRGGTKGLRVAQECGSGHM